MIIFPVTMLSPVAVGGVPLVVPGSGGPNTIHVADSRGLNNTCNWYGKAGGWVNGPGNITMTTTGGNYLGVPISIPAIYKGVAFPVSTFTLTVTW